MFIEFDLDFKNQKKFQHFMTISISFLFAITYFNFKEKEII